MENIKKFFAGYDDSILNNEIKNDYYEKYEELITNKKIKNTIKSKLLLMLDLNESFENDEERRKLEDDVYTLGDEVLSDELKIYYALAEIAAKKNDNDKLRILEYFRKTKLEIGLTEEEIEKYKMYITNAQINLGIDPKFYTVYDKFLNNNLDRYLKKETDEESNTDVKEETNTLRLR